MKAKLFLLAMVTIALVGCTDDLERRGSYSPEGGLQATIPAYPFDGGTRVSISDDLQTFTWSNGDQIGIYYLDGNITAHAGFGILTGGGTTGTFTNSAFSLHPSSTYYGFYPFDETASVGAAPVDFTGQVQTVDESAAHLGAMNYMYSVVNTDEEGNAQITFHNLGAVMAIRMYMPASDVYSSLEIYSDNEDFISTGEANMTDGIIYPTTRTNNISLSFGTDGLTLNNMIPMTFYLLTAPVDMSESNLTFILHAKDGTNYNIDTRTGKNMKAGRAYLYDLLNRNAPYVTFTASAEQTLQMSQEVPSLEYSVNEDTWEVLGTKTVTFGGNHGNLRLRGKASQGTNGATISFGNATPVACSGDIRTLVDYENHDGANTSEAKFNSLFFGCTQLTTAPDLPATTLAEACYDHMFRGCTSLTEAPELPATTLAVSCYLHMFQDCTSLASAPELPATTLAPSCYANMFSGCTYLTTAPELPATTLVNNCYSSMFYSCSSLTQAPELPATILSQNCYSGMFDNCTSLTTAPELPATDLAPFCYTGMFARCTSLTQAPELPATTLSGGCYFMMFVGCTSLTQAPELPATTLTPNCYWGMFQYCSQLSYIRMMATDISASNCLRAWVDGVSSSGIFVQNKVATWWIIGINGIPEGWNVETMDGTPYVTFTANAEQTLRMSQEVSSLQYSVNGGTWTTLGTNTVTFGGTNGKLRLRGKSSEGTNGATISFGNTTPVFCSGDIRTLVDYENYETTNTGSAKFNSLFSDCSALVTAPDLPATNLAPNCYAGMFGNCTSLTSAPKLPATTLSDFCYIMMFVECKSLTQAPELPATTLTTYCYYGMFQNCSQLSYIRMMATDISAPNCLNYWVYGVSSSGTFVKNAAATWDNTGVVPEGWAVELRND